MFIPCSAVLAGGSPISTLASSSFNDGMNRVMLGAAGNHQTEFVALMSQLSRGQISTRLLTALSAPALGVSNIIFRNVAQGGTGSSTYKSLAGGATTLCVPKRISWNAGGPATLDVEILFFSSNGSTAPVTVGVVGGTNTAESSVWVGAGDGISSIVVDFGFEVSIPPDGYLYPKNGFIVSQQPSIAMTYIDEAEITQANIQPGAIATLTAQFALIADGGVRGNLTSYAVTGHKHIASVDGSKPGRVQVVCAGKGGLTIT